MSKLIAIFEGREIRKVWHDGEWWFSVADVIEVLSETTNIRDYIKKIRKRDKDLDSYWGTNCPPLEMLARDGKYYLSDAADTEVMLRLSHSRLSY